MLDVSNLGLEIFDRIFRFITNKRKPEFTIKKIDFKYMHYGAAYINIDMIIKNHRNFSFNIYDLSVVLKNEKDEEVHRLYDISDNEKGIYFDDEYIEEVSIEAKGERLIHSQAGFMLNSTNKSATELFFQYQTSSKKYNKKIYTFDKTFKEEIGKCYCPNFGGIVSK